MAGLTPNIGASVRQRLLNRARVRGIDYNLLLLRFLNERVLYRLSRSPHRDSFVLKGAMTFDLCVDAGHRPTRDIDLLGFGQNAPDALTIAAFRNHDARGQPTIAVKARQVWAISYWTHISGSGQSGGGQARVASRQFGGSLRLLRNRCIAYSTILERSAREGLRVGYRRILFASRRSAREHIQQSR